MNDDRVVLPPPDPRLIGTEYRPLVRTEEEPEMLNEAVAWSVARTWPAAVREVFRKVLNDHAGE